MSSVFEVWKCFGQIINKLLTDFPKVSEAKKRVVAFDQLQSRLMECTCTMETRYGWVANIRRKWYGIEATVRRLVGQKVGFHRSFDFRSPVSCLRADRFEGWASRERTRRDNGLLWTLPPAPPAAVTWRSSWSNNRMNLVICHYSFSLKASLHSKEKAHVLMWRGAEMRNISQVKLLGTTKSWSLSNNRGGRE